MRVLGFDFAVRMIQFEGIPFLLGSSQQEPLLHFIFFVRVWILGMGRS